VTQIATLSVSNPMNLENLISLLSDGNFHSGEELSEALGVSRTAIWKQVAKLENFGLQVNAVKGKGYRLQQDIDLLSLEVITASLNDSALEVFNHIDLHLSTESTNRLAAAATKVPHVCMAEMQSAGRGRRGREWVSPFAKNIYLSLAWRFSEAGPSLDSLSLCVAVALAKALKALGCDGVELKWPNDVLVDGSKLAGILLEAAGEVGGPVRVVIGIGLNVAMSQDQGMKIDQDWVALNNLVPQRLSRNEIAAALINEMAIALPKFEQHGFAGFDQDWRSFDCLVSRPVKLLVGSGEKYGVARGVDSTGALLIEHDGGIKSYRGGEVSVRVRDET